ncbi:MAG: hypothetical protein KC609_09115 [Myxococcales bacterium]|nr:hypothetical protein [Myxococcales bacterium]
MRIFVSIAAYRDPELVPTIADALAKATEPSALRFGVCWQHGDEETLGAFADDRRVRVIDIDWRESRGACWARSEIMGLFEGEELYLQLDSHHRFVEGWDRKLIRHIEQSGSTKPILSTYLPTFSPSDPSSFAREPTQMNFDRFTSEGIILFRPGVIAGWQTRTKPVRGRFLSGHFLFAPGSFVEDVPYDPALYFTGEEITLAVRAFTHGWDFFQPCEVVAWHEYTRAYRPHKHWTDHHKGNQIETEWHQRDAQSKERVGRFLENPEIGRFGCGSARTFAEYEAFAGVSFRRRRAQPYTQNHLEPPNPTELDDWADRVARYDFEIPIERSQLPEGAAAAAFWYCGFHDGEEREIHRADLGQEEIRSLLSAGGDTIRLRRGFESAREPRSWSLWPCAPEARWLDKIRGEVHIHRPAVTTFVTALLDIGRERLGPAFARSFDGHYRPAFERLLAIDAPLVVYADRVAEALVWKHRNRANTKVIPVSTGELERRSWFPLVERIRKRAEWRSGATWLAESPQARLAHYNPLVFSKLPWLAEVARRNPFGTGSFVWIDAGLAHTVDARKLLDPALPLRLAEATQEPLFAAFPYPDASEIHGFPTRELAALSGVRHVEWVVRGGLFGGRAGDLIGIAALYARWLDTTLSAGMMGTEESILTLLAHRYPELLRPIRIAGDGLLAPLVDALLKGNLESPRVALGVGESHSPVSGVAGRKADAAESGVGPEDSSDVERESGAPQGLYRDDPEGARVGWTRCWGLPMMQNRNAPAAFDALFRHIEQSGQRLARIVEIGTGQGGLTVLLQLYCTSVGAELLTYDHDANRMARTAGFDRLGIDLRVRDVREAFVSAEIAREIQRDGMTLLILDGGDKVDDANRFADHLKPGDLLMVHDYVRSRAHFDESIRGRLWSWCEATDADLESTSRRNGLVEILPEVFHPAVWTCRVKRGQATREAPRANTAGVSTALYAISFNLPEQLALWLASVEGADPAFLRETEKFLLDNSTDPATTPHYARLCERYGFVHLRRGNLGITGGRVFCAEHFAASEHELMLYFEDDMLLVGEAGLCSNGMPRHVPGLFHKLREIIANEEGLDFLKLSFTEFFGDHRINWAYKNLDEEAQRRYFPQGPSTRVEAIRSHDGLAYLIGEVHYSNWPMLITRRGNQALFPGGSSLPLHEQGMMVRALELARAGELRGGVLLASPIDHRREHHYPATARREA